MRVIAVAAILLVAMAATIALRGPSGDALAPPSGPQPVRLLADLPAEGALPVLLLHPLATGEGYRMIDDAAALRANMSAFFLDEPDGTGPIRLTFKAVVGIRTHALYASLHWPDGRVQAIRCLRRLCEGPDHMADLGTLPDHARPVASDYIEVEGHPAYRATIDGVLADPDAILSHTPDPPRDAHPGAYRIERPATRLSFADEAAHTEATAQAEALAATIQATLADAGIETTVTALTERVGARILDAATGRALRDPVGEVIPSGDLAFHRATLIVRGPEGIDTALAAAVPDRIWSDGDQADLDAWITARLAEAGSPLTPEDVTVELASDWYPRTEIGPFRPDRYVVGLWRVVP